MKDRNMRVCVRAVLFTSLFSSIAFADTDIINWETNAGGTPPIGFSFPAVVITDEGATVTVNRGLEGSGGIIPSFGFPDSTEYFPGWSLQAIDALYWTNIQAIGNALNPITFYDFNGISVCGFSTHIAPQNNGPFTAEIKAFTSDANLSGSTSGNTHAESIDISSTEPMESVVITMLTTGGDPSYPSSYTINHVELTTCDTAPKLFCDGFAAPMDIFPVSAKKNRAFPLKMELFSDGGTEQTDLDLIASPVVTVMFTDSNTDDPVYVNEMTLATGHGTEGNQFEFTDDGIWQFNLRSKNYSASGTYLVTVVSGDEDEYVIDPACVTSFMIK